MCALYKLKILVKVSLGSISPQDKDLAVAMTTVTAWLSCHMCLHACSPEHSLPWLPHTQPTCHFPLECGPCLLALFLFLIHHIVPCVTPCTWSVSQSVKYIIFVHLLQRYRIPTQLQPLFSFQSCVTWLLLNFSFYLGLASMKSDWNLINKLGWYLATIPIKRFVTTYGCCWNPPSWAFSRRCGLWEVVALHNLFCSSDAHLPCSSSALAPYLQLKVVWSALSLGHCSYSGTPISHHMLCCIRLVPQVCPSDTQWIRTIASHIVGPMQYIICHIHAVAWLAILIVACMHTLHLLFLHVGPYAYRGQSLCLSWHLQSVWSWCPCCCLVQQMKYWTTKKPIGKLSASGIT